MKTFLRQKTLIDFETIPYMQCIILRLTVWTVATLCLQLRTDPTTSKLTFVSRFNSSNLLSYVAGNTSGMQHIVNNLISYILTHIYK